MTLSCAKVSMFFCKSKVRGTNGGCLDPVKKSISKKTMPTSLIQGQSVSGVSILFFTRFFLLQKISWRLFCNYILIK